MQIINFGTIVRMRLFIEMYKKVDTSFIEKQLKTIIKFGRQKDP